MNSPLATFALAPGESSVTVPVMRMLFPSGMLVLGAVMVVLLGPLPMQYIWLS